MSSNTAANDGVVAAERDLAEGNSVDAPPVITLLENTRNLNDFSSPLSESACSYQTPRLSLGYQLDFIDKITIIVDELRNIDRTLRTEKLKSELRRINAYIEKYHK